MGFIWLSPLSPFVYLTLPSLFTSFSSVSSFRFGLPLAVQTAAGNNGGGSRFVCSITTRHSIGVLGGQGRRVMKLLQQL
jgi:hypothetical protein